MGSEQGGLGRAAAGLGALEPSPPHPPQPLLLPTAVWGSPALAKAGSAPSHGDMLPMGSRDAVGFGGCIHPDAGCPPSSATGSGTAVPSCPPCHQPCSSPHGSNPPPPQRCPPLTSHSPRAGGRWVQSCTDPGLTAPVPASTPALLFPASVSERPAWPGLLPTAGPPLPKLPGEPSKAIAVAEHPHGCPLAHGLCPRGMGKRVTGDGRAQLGWTPATERRGAGICAGEERLVPRPPSFPPALMTNKCPTDVVPCCAVPCRPGSAVFGGGCLGSGEGGLVWGGGSGPRPAGLGSLA